jgi:hypothetical protein
MAQASDGFADIRRASDRRHSCAGKHTVSCISKALRFYLPFADQAEMVRQEGLARPSAQRETMFEHLKLFEQERRLAPNQDRQQSTNFRSFGA